MGKKIIRFKLRKLSFKKLQGWIKLINNKNINRNLKFEYRTVKERHKI